MATRIRTLNFLPEVFRTTTNNQFLSATLDQIVDQPNTAKVEGYIGSKFGYGINANSKYVVEPDKTRTNYQLDPGVVFTKKDTDVAQDFISYPGLLDALSLEGGLTDNNERLFQSQFYSWDSFTSLDKLVNFTQYYWLPSGPPAITISTDTVYNFENYTVTNESNDYLISYPQLPTGAVNPTLTLLRGGTYTFDVSQNSSFWIQGAPGVTGYDPTQPNVQTRDVYGVINNGIENGVVTFNVPYKDAQSEYNFPGNNKVDLVSNIPFDQVNGKLLSELQNIDGITSLNGRTLLFFNTGVLNDTGFTSAYYNESGFDTNTELVPTLTIQVYATNSVGNLLVTDSTTNLIPGQTITFAGTTFGGIPIYSETQPNTIFYVKTVVSPTEFTISLTPNGTEYTVTTDSGLLTGYIDQGLYEEGYYSQVNDYFYKISYVGDPQNPVIRLTPYALIPVSQKITANYGTQWGNKNFYKNVDGYINLVPYLSSLLDTLYYQDGSSANKVGTIKLVDSNSTNIIDVTLDILGKKTYTAPNGLEFTNGLKIIFQGAVYPVEYQNKEYYVEGVGTSINLIPATDLFTFENFTEETYVPYGITSYDTEPWDGILGVPFFTDYITIARDSIDQNPWSRSNRWFHISVIEASAQFNNNPSILDEYATNVNKAKRPIIEFYPNLKLFNSGIEGKGLIDFVDANTLDAFNEVAGQTRFYPDNQVSTGYTATINSVTSGTSTTITVPTSSINGTFLNGLYVLDNQQLLPDNTEITAVDVNSTTTTLTVSWGFSLTIPTTSGLKLIANATQNDNFSLFDGAKIVFINDNDTNVRNKIYTVRFSKIQENQDPVITLTEEQNGDVFENQQVSAIRGYTYSGKTIYFDGTIWNLAQQKVTVNQPPLFDIFDKNGISLGNPDYYLGTSFKGCKLFSYGLGTGTNDSVLGFPIKYSSVNNIGDISFDVSFNKDTFSYVYNSNPITENVGVGYVYQYNDLTNYTRKIGWETGQAESVQYQLFEFTYNANNTQQSFVLDVPAVSESNWPIIKVFVNNNLQDASTYTYDVVNQKTLVTFTPSFVALTDFVLEIAILSDYASSIGYYEIPLNLNNNPLNENLESINLGDIKNQYQSIYINNPDIQGPVFGSNNYRDLGNIINYGTKIVQNSSSLVLPGVFLRNQDYSLFNALMFSSKEYVTFKTLLVDTINKTDYTSYMTPASILDDAISQITANKDTSSSFFWSDMLPNKTPYVTNTYKFSNGADVTRYPLSKIYDFTKANYEGLLVYVNRIVDGIQTQIQLLRNIDYVVSTDSPIVTVNYNLLSGDVVVIQEYNQTYGSYIPNTPTKLGLYPATIPDVVLDSNYLQPTYFIVGHDGSYNRLYGEYIDGALTDIRDQALLEFEKRIFNNLKLDGIELPISQTEILPGYFRSTSFSYDEFMQVYSEGFLNWVGQNRVDFQKQIYNSYDEYTWNYNNSSDKLNNSQILQGYWRGIYKYYYDTFDPNTSPWEMLGYTNKPNWWENYYGSAPYTSDNLVLWSDLENGIDYNNGNPVVIESVKRPGLTKILPVDDQGNLVSPFVSIVGNYEQRSFNRDWQVGDIAPAELSYRRSSTWPFDLVRLMALAKPAKFFNLAADLDEYRFNSEFNQYLVNDRNHLDITQIQIYGNGIPKTSYINWIVDYQKQVGLDATTNISELLNNVDVRLVYRLAGYSDKSMLKFYIERGSPNSTNASLLIPDQNYSVLLYNNVPFDRIVYTGVVVQITNNGYKVYGNSQTKAYFKVLAPKNNGNTSKVTVENLSVNVANDYTDKVVTVPYGQEFYSYQAVSQFLESYGAYLTSQGMVFNSIENGLEITWRQMTAEFLYWAQSGWEIGSLININPSAKSLLIDKDDRIVMPLTLQQQNFILNQNLYPIQSTDMAVVRDGTSFLATALNQGDSISYGQFNISNFENGIVFDNQTIFNDVIYNLVTGLRQNRMLLRGTKTADWNGEIDAQGFIISQDNIREWDPTVKYTKGEIVKYKNKFWVALDIVLPNIKFQEKNWKLTTQLEIQTGLLPNSSTRSYESTLYYDVNQANLENDADLLSFSLIGYRPRDYLALADLTDITQINIYRNIIKEKGTITLANAFKGANLPQGTIDYDIYENWAIKTSEFGGVLNNNFIDIKLNQPELTGNPFIVGLTDGVWTEGVQQEVPIYSIYNYGRPITSIDVLPTVNNSVNTLLPSAGYVNYNDVKTSSFYYSGLNNNSVSLNDVFVNEYLWLASFKGTWDVLTPLSIGQISKIVNNLNNTITVVFDNPHTLSKYDPFAIVNFNNNVNGYYIANSIVDDYTVIVSATLNSQLTVIYGTGIGLKLVSQRVSTPADINSLPLNDFEFVKNKVWVDTKQNGDWGVYQKDINYQLNDTLTKNESETFGSALAYTKELGYLVSDARKGEVYRYIYNPVFDLFSISETLTGDANFGYSISHNDDIFVISQPTGTNKYVSIYKFELNELQNKLTLLQEPINAPAGCEDWGKSTAISGDGNWLFISDNTNNFVYVYRKSVDKNIYEYSSTIVVNTNSAQVDSMSLSTDYYGTVLTVGTPNENNGEFSNYGNSYVFNRLNQTIEITSPNTPGINQTFDLAWIPLTIDFTVTASTASSNTLTVANNSNIKFGDTFIIYGNTLLSILNYNTVYYTNPIIGSSTDFEVYQNKVSTNMFQSLSGTNQLLLSTDISINSGNPLMVYGNVGVSGLTTNTLYYVNTVQNVVFDNKTYQAITLLDSTLTPVTLSDSDVYANIVVLTNKVTLTDDSGSMSISLNNVPITVKLNGHLLDDSNYAIVNNQISFVNNLLPGDIVTIDTQTLVFIQNLNTNYQPRVGVKFGTSTDVNQYGNEILVGAPFLLIDNKEGGVFRYTNSGSKYGYISGKNDCYVTNSTSILINGYLVNIPAGNAETIAYTINQARLPNIVSFAENNRLTIQLVDVSLAPVNSKLILSVLDSRILGQLGIELYSLTQFITDPHSNGPTQFGYRIKFNQFGSIVVTAPRAAKILSTTFDFTDDENYDNDTIFDNNSTKWIDSFENSGSAYMYDYIPTYNENINNVGNYVYAQSINNTDINYGLQPYYGTSLEFNDYTVLIGTPLLNPGTINGSVNIFTNEKGVQDWNLYRESSPVIDINKIQNTLLYSAYTNNIISNLDYIDPLQGKMLGVIHENVDVISNADPATYNSPNTANNSGILWGERQVGFLWFDTSSTKFVNYHQNDDVVYNSKYWGQTIEGSDVAVYSWISSNVAPINYAGTGTPKSLSDYVVENAIDSAGNLTNVYYYWVRNTNIIFTKKNKTISDTICESYIKNPQASGISYFAPVSQNVFSLYNSNEYLNGNDTVLHVGYSTGNNDDQSHELFSLIRSDFADDFLPGLPKNTGFQLSTEPQSLYKQLLNSLTGVNTAGSIVPDPYLPKPVQYGIYTRPSQSFFINRFTALKNYLEYVNNVLIQYPITELRNYSFLFKTGEFYNTQDYWSYVDWWAEGYDNNTKASVMVPVYADLVKLTPYQGLIATVGQNESGLSETYIYTNGNWVRIGVKNGTIAFDSALWDYNTPRLGFGDNFFDTTSFDVYPSEETRNIVRCINEQLLIDDLLIERNKALILLFEYIQSEAIEAQNYLPWLNKTSLIDVSHIVRKLEPIQIYQNDNQAFLEGYLNEVKPYHVVIKEFLFKYTGTDTYSSDLTDFDLPASYNPNLGIYQSPQLSYSSTLGDDQYLPSDPIWNNSLYSDWFNNYGLSLTGISEYNISSLVSYLGTNTSYIIVDNVYGMPSNGTIQIGNEFISYSKVIKETNVLTGLARGINDTPISAHLPGEKIFMNLDPVIILDGARGYVNTPKVTAYIDTTKYPAPRTPAILQAQMSLDSVLSIKVIDPGSGYAVTPEIRIDPANITSFTDSDVDLVNSVIITKDSFLKTGDLVKYVCIDSEIGGIGGIQNNQYYYVSVQQIGFSYHVSLYNSYLDAIYLRGKLQFTSLEPSSNCQLLFGARAVPITRSLPVREVVSTLRFDRTSYTPVVKDWVSGAYYGSFYAGLYNNSAEISSSSILLESTMPPIDEVLASAQGIAFEIQSVSNVGDIKWSSRTRDIVGLNNLFNTVEIAPSTGGAATAGTIVPTIGFYVGMPIMFTGDISGIPTNTIFYVKEIVNDSNITFSIIRNGVTPGPVYSLSSAYLGINGAKLIVGEETNVAKLYINYPNIETATNTTDTINTVTVPLWTSGLGGTQGWWPGLPVFFVGNVFGGVVENEIYYVNSIIDEQTVTLNKTSDIIQIDVYSTSATDNSVNIDNSNKLKINDPIIIGNALINGVSVTNFGNIISGNLYYVHSIVSNTKIKLTTEINGPEFVLSNVSSSTNTSAVITSQANVLKLQTANGSMTLNAGLPVSPGQIDGQQLTFYHTSNQYTGITLNNTSNNLVRKTISSVTESTPGIGGWLSITKLSGGLDNIYVNMPIQLSTNFGGLTSSTTYFITEIGTISTVASGTSSSTNEITVLSTDGFYVGMPVTFSPNGYGGLQEYQTYYVKTITSNTTFTVSETIDGFGVPGSVVVLTNDNRTMNVTGSDYVKISNTLAGPNLALTNDFSYINPVTLTQINTNNAIVDVSYVLGGYRVLITTTGTGYAVNNQFVIPGNLIGGATPTNDLYMEVNNIDNLGGILSLICSGNPAGSEQKYFIKVVSSNEIELYYDSLMKKPVNGLNFPYYSAEQRSSAVYQTTATANTITLNDSSFLEVNDKVVFTGNTFGNLVLGKYYYVTSINNIDNTITVSETIGGSDLILTTASGICTVAKQGDFAFLKEPFNFTQSIVKYNNRVYECIISNNDTEFIIGKWQLLQSSDRRLNALDRINGYYEPTVNMPGKDLTQLMTGISYPNSTYYDNAFEPSEEFDLDLNLKDTDFYPTEVNSVGVLWNGVNYLIPTNTLNLSGVLKDVLSQWTIEKVSSQPISVTGIYNDNGFYVLTTFNKNTPIFISEDGVNWTSSGEYNPYSFNPYDTTNFDITSLLINQTQLNSVTKFNGNWVAVGTNIVNSPDGYVWTPVYSFTDTTALLNSVTGFSNYAFTGYVTVGKINNGITDIGISLSSTDGINWSLNNNITNNALNSVTSNGTICIAVGNNGTIYSTTNGSNWTGINESQVLLTNGLNNQLTVISTIGFNVNEQIRFSGVTFGGLVSDTSYYIVSITGPTTLTVSETLGGSPVTLTTATPEPSTSMVMYKYPVLANLNAIAYSNNIFMAVGDNGTIISSTDGSLWNVLNSGVTNNLHGIAYNSDDGIWIAVGDKNAIIESADNGQSWTSVSIFAASEVTYDVVGDEFTSGYGPEELVPGIVSDNISLLINTRTGSTWASSEYGNTGYKSISKLTPIKSYVSTVSFAGMTEEPTQLVVYHISNSSNLGTRLYEGVNYTVDWINQNIVLTNLIPIGDSIEIFAYEVGNGNQLIRENTFDYPSTINSSTNFSQINLNCNYTASAYQGYGLIKGSSAIASTSGLSTDSTDNSITVNNASIFVINSTVQISGVAFGGLVSGNNYFIKTVDSTANKITLSDSLVNGIAGPTVTLSSASGTMGITTLVGNGQVYTDPVVYRNGVRLVLGSISTVIQTSSVDNSISLNTSDILNVNDYVYFSQNVGGLSTDTKYYIVSVINPNQIVVSLTLGGSPVVLTDSMNISYMIRNDYAITPAALNSTSAAIQFGLSYNASSDFISYTLFGETFPVQYGYTLPESQPFVADGITNTFVLDNYLGGTNVKNAVVEVNGLRLTPTTDYTINNQTQVLTLTSTPSANAIVNVTSYNFTENQYLNTKEFINVETYDIAAVSNNISLPFAQLGILSTNSANNSIVVTDTSSVIPNSTVLIRAISTNAGNFVIGNSYKIEYVGTTDFTLIGAANNNVGTIFVATGAGTGTGFALIQNLGGAIVGQYYYVNSVLSPTEFTISNTLGGPILTLSSSSGYTATAIIGGQETIRVTTTNNTTLVTNDIVRIDGIIGSTQLNNNYYYVKMLSSNVFDLYLQPYQVNLSQTNYPLSNVSAYVSGGYVWKDQTFTIYDANILSTNSIDNSITVDDVSNFIIGTPVIFTEYSKNTGDITIGGLIVGTTYYVSSISTVNNSFTVVLNRNDTNTVSLTTDSNIVNSPKAGQWIQQDVDRLWVTINGYRVPSSSLKINENNNLSILEPIQSTDVVIITSMIPTYTPSRLLYMQNVNKYGEQKVYRLPADSQVWLTKPLKDTSSLIFVNDVTKLTDKVVQTGTVVVGDTGLLQIGLNVDKNTINSVSVLNTNNNVILGDTDYYITTVNSAPTLIITKNAVEGNVLEITIFLGKTLYIDGEQIRFGNIDLLNNAVTIVQRGINGTGIKPLYPVNTLLFALKSSNLMDANYYNQTWNSYNFNEIKGDPLQISTTNPAIFLRNG